MEVLVIYFLVIILSQIRLLSITIRCEKYITAKTFTWLYELHGECFIRRRNFLLLVRTWTYPLFCGGYVCVAHFFSFMCCVFGVCLRSVSCDQCCLCISELSILPFSFVFFQRLFNINIYIYICVCSWLYILWDSILYTLRLSCSTAIRFLWTLNEPILFEAFECNFI